MTPKTVCAIIALLLCAPVILGLSFLAHNNIFIDHACCTVIDKVSGLDLLKSYTGIITCPTQTQTKGLLL